ncbi:GerMN domain-containing protein [Frondihabitans sp. PhB188]|uniref:GerMN domain-containing protein n=1 Tax=Frondihabitans sp. PhB188 TaxID=2485200 RepID=UPI00131544DE|nr:GerMN domain-containing protein [Frondihabitans sp. PhB188]
MRAVRAALVAAASVVVLVGCATIPSTGGVETGDPISNKIESDIEYLPSGPIAGSDQERILRGFIEAGTGSQGDYKVARQYLTSTEAKKWDPRAGVVVRQGSGTFAAGTDGAATYTVQSVASVDAEGHYAEAQPSDTVSLQFAFQKVGGEWRISRAPSGIVLSTANFDLVFRPHAIYFYDPTFTYLVPDERWFLARTSPTTHIVEALLGGPSPWLNGAVESAFPAKAKLGPGAVTVSSGTARVDLSSGVEGLDATERSRMRAQLVASFSTVTTVSAVEISADGANLSIPNDTGGAALTDPQVDARPLVLSKGAFGWASASSVSPVAGLSKAVVALKPTSVELSTDQKTAAVGTADGTFVVTDQGVSRRVDSRSGLAAPTLDGQGLVWSAQTDDPRSMIAYDAEGVAHPVSTDLPSDQQLVGFTVSRDGTRVAILLDNAGTTRLLVASIQRDAKHMPTALGNPLELTPPAGSPVSVTWVDELTIGTLSTSGTGSSLVSEHDVGGESTDLGTPSGTAVNLVGGNGADGVRVLTASGTLLEPRGNGWEDTGISADLLATQR